MIQLSHVNARFDQFRLRDITLRVPGGQYCVLLGPPGSGKTSIIEIICGLRPKLDGRVALDGQPVDKTDPADRHVGYVPQDYALFPTLSVRDNIAFGLAIRHRPHGDIRDRVAEMAGRLNIAHLLDRSCRGLSGGERQRVALARALVLEPKILLLDEPVSALDQSTRQRVCLELRHLHDALGMTTIHISHNFEETRSVADMVGVVNAGRIVQAGSVEQIFRRPETEFVARFVQAGNVLHGIASQAGLELVSRAVPGPDEVQSGSLVELAGKTIRFPGHLLGSPGPVALLLRPHDATILPPGQAPSPGRVALTGTVVSVHDNGGFQVTVRVAVTPADLLSIAVLKLDEQPVAWRAGDAAQVVFDPARLHPLIADIKPDEEVRDEE